MNYNTLSDFGSWAENAARSHTQNTSDFTDVKFLHDVSSSFKTGLYLVYHFIHTGDLGRRVRANSDI